MSDVQIKQRWKPIFNIEPCTIPVTILFEVCANEGRKFVYLKEPIVPWHQAYTLLEKCAYVYDKI